MAEMGPAKVKEKLGVNATGLPFNSIEAIEQNKAAEDPPTGNPLVNAGAIATVGNLEATSSSDRWKKVFLDVCDDTTIDAAVVDIQLPADQAEAWKKAEKSVF